MNELIRGDCIEVMKRLPEKSVDLVFGSPPYEDARTYGIDFKLKGQDWVDWMVQVYGESLRVCKGLVAFVVAGRTHHYEWSAAPALLVADLKRAGVCIRNPPIYYRSGIPGSGGPDWLRSDYEWLVCATNGGKLPWSDNTSCGNEPKFGPGGDPTNRKRDGKRIRLSFTRPADKSGTSENYITTIGGIVEFQNYKPPKKANPGNVIRCSGGHLGSKIAHENEAPFPEKLADFFVRSFCPPDGIVLDPFLGSGTTIAVAQKTGRNWIGIDCRQSQLDLTLRRLKEETDYGKQ
jgi:site-specific DNA-methyltransferase (adenine-specific)